MDHLKNLPEVFENYFVTNNKIHQHNTRNASKLYKCYKRTNYVKHSLSNKGIDVWDALESKFKGTNSYNVFKKEMKQYLSEMKQYPTLCARRDSLCIKTFDKMRQPDSRLNHLIPPSRANEHNCNLRYGNRLTLFPCKTERFKKSFFPTMCIQSHNL